MPQPRKQNVPAEDLWLASHKAAEVAGMSRLKLYELALSGEVRTQKVAGRRVFAREDIELLAVAREAATAA